MDCAFSHTIKAQVSYHGAYFSGFARQPGQSTVQGTMEEALELLYKRFIETTCAGRTDAGVHARGQIISFNLSHEEFESRSLSTLERSLNALIDDHCSVSSIEEAPFGFSARFDAVAREYHYHIYSGKNRPVLMKDFVWHIKKDLNVKDMQDAACYLIGEHDFKSFCLAASAANKPTCRNVHEISFEQIELFGDNVLSIKVVGNAFLHSMVRTIVGTLVDVGVGRKESSWVKEVLEAKDRSAAGENAPACGLVFWRVFY